MRVYQFKGGGAYFIVSGTKILMMDGVTYFSTLEETLEYFLNRKLAHRDNRHADENDADVVLEFKDKDDLLNRYPEYLV
jgi:hypothetical protein